MIESKSVIKRKALQSGNSKLAEFLVNGQVEVNGPDNKPLIVALTPVGRAEFKNKYPHSSYCAHKYNKRSQAECIGEMEYKTCLKCGVRGIVNQH